MTAGKSSYPGATSKAYFTNDNASWTTVTANDAAYFMNPMSSIGGSYNKSRITGWYYFPFSSFLYQGAGGAGTNYAKDDNGDYTDVAMKEGVVDLESFMNRFYPSQDFFRIGAKTSNGQTGLVFGDVYFVYPDAPNASDKDATSSLNIYANNKEGGTASSTLAGGVLTVKGATGNTATNSANRVWIKQSNNTDMNWTGASGIRFHVDTTALGADAQLHIRLRLQTPTGLRAISTDSSFFAQGATNGYVAQSSLPTSWMQFVTRSGRSVAYYDGTVGVGGAAATGSVSVNSTYYSSVERDFFDALPANFVGDVYIPIDSYVLSAASYGSSFVSMPGSDLFQARLAAISAMAICHYIEGTPATDSVAYSNFELVYADTDLAGASVTVQNDLTVNFFANVQEGATGAQMTFSVGSKNSTVTLAQAEEQPDGSYLFPCTDILPQSIGDTITATLSATVSGRTVSVSTEYSVKDYCLNMLRKDGTSAALKQLLVDLLYYGADAQTYGIYRKDALATADLTSAEQALRSADATGSITAELAKSGSENSDYAFVSAALRLENRMAFRFTFKAASTDNLTVSIQTGTRDAIVFDSFIDNGDGTYSVIFNDIAANEFDTAVSATLLQSGVQIGQSISYSVAAYIKDYNATAQDAHAVALLRSIYGFGRSAIAYLASL